MARGDRRDWRWNDVPMRGAPPARPIRVAIVPEVPGGKSHPAQVAAVRLAGKHLRGAGYVVEEILPPDIERCVELWHQICVTDVHPALDRALTERGYAEPTAAWLSIHKPVDLATYIGALTEREALLFKWMTFMQQWPLVIFPTLCDLPPKQVADITPDGQRGVLESMRSALVAPLFGLPGLAVPAGLDGQGLPLGLQLIGRPFDEETLFALGEVIEQAAGRFPVSGRCALAWRPPLAATLHPAAPHHLPPFITAPNETDAMMVLAAVIIISSVLGFGLLFLRLHTLPERMAHKAHKLQFEIVAVLGLLALFTHIHLFWVAGLLLALIEIPDVWNPLRRMAGALDKIAGIPPERDEDEP
eukprot:gene42203-56057_t